MNWYKIAKNFLKNPSNLDGIINDIFSKIKETDLNTLSNRGLITQTMIDNPYLNISVPVAVFLVDNINGDKNTQGGSFTDLYDTLAEHQKEGRQLLKIDALELDDGGYTPHEMVFSDYENYVEEWGMDLLQSYIEINLKAHENNNELNGNELKKTIYHELTHILDPAQRSKTRKNYKMPEQHGFEAYLNNPIEYNARMTEVKNSIILSLEQEMSIDDKINTLEMYLAYIKSGNVEMVLELIGISGDVYDDFAIYYLQNPKMNRMVMEQIARMLFNLLNEYKNNKVKTYELV